jgi:hypothetical protein
VLVGKVIEIGRPLRSRRAPGFYPLGTAFAVKTPLNRHLLSTYHTISDNDDCTEWYITLQVDRCAKDGVWNFEGTTLTKVTVWVYDKANDIVVLTVPEPFSPSAVVEICPLDAIPMVADECLFKTYYCPIEDITAEPTFHPLAPSASDNNKKNAIKNSENGHMWLRGGLCGGSSGGVVVNQDGRAVGMHCISSSSGLTVQNVKENDERNGKRARRPDDMSFHSDSISSLANSHASSQVVVLLSQNNMVRESVSCCRSKYSKNPYL